jgi:hypothetical protein
MIEGNTNNRLPMNPKMEKQMNIKRAFLISLALMLLPAFASADLGEINITPAPGTAVFVVQKHFTDLNVNTEVTFHMDCDTGQPTEQQRTTSSENPNFEVAFVLDVVPDGDVTCTIYEEPVAGYTAEYDCPQNISDSNSASHCDNNGPSALNCEFSEIESSDTTDGDGDVNYCIIDNAPDPIEVVITKDWVVEGTIGN